MSGTKRTFHPIRPGKALRSLMNDLEDHFAPHLESEIAEILVKWFNRNFIRFESHGQISQFEIEKYNYSDLKEKVRYDAIRSHANEIFEKCAIDSLALDVETSRPVPVRPEFRDLDRTDFRKIHQLRLETWVMVRNEKEEDV